MSEQTSRRVPGSRRDMIGRDRHRTCAHCGAAMVLPPHVASRKLRCSVACDLDSGLDKSGPPHPVLGTPCWTWTRAKNRRGHGLTTVARVREQAHRVAWIVAHGDVPAGLHVLHECDNPPCCNPDHLRTGTRVDNMQDAIAKGRFCMGDRHPARTRGDYLPRGEQHWSHRAAVARRAS